MPTKIEFNRLQHSFPAQEAATHENSKTHQRVLEALLIRQEQQKNAANWLKMDLDTTADIYEIQELHRVKNEIGGAVY